MRKLKLLCLSAVFSMMFAGMLGAAWTSKRLTFNTDNYSPAIAGDGANVYVVWENGSVSDNDEIYFRRSADNGTTWQSAKRLTNNTGYSEVPAIAVSGANVFVVWEDDTPGNNEIYFSRSTDNGATWRAEQNLTGNTGSSDEPAIAANGEKVYVAWHDDLPGNEEVYFRRSIDGGATWKIAKRLSNNSGSSSYVGIAVQAANIYVVWRDETPGNREIYFRKSADGGVNWENAKRLTNTAAESYYPVVAAEGTNVYVAWYEVLSNDREIYFSKSTDNGATWESAQRLTNNVGDSFRPVLASSGPNIYLAWYDYTPGDEEIYFRKSIDRGANWQGIKRLTNDAGYSEFPAIAVNATNVYVAWCDYKSGYGEIYVKYSPL